MPVAAAVGNVAYDLAGPKRRLIARQPGPADGPAAGSTARVRSAARRAFRNYAKYLVDMMRLGELTDGGRRGASSSIENIEILDEARAEGKGVLLCTVHVGGMDIIGAGAEARTARALHVVADDTTYGRLYDHLPRPRAPARHLRHRLAQPARACSRCCATARTSCSSATAATVAATCRSSCAASRPRCRSGRPRWRPRPARRCCRSPAAATADDRFVARGLPLIHCASTDPVEIYRATQAVADALGEVIAEDPGQWYMFRPVWPQTDADRAHAARGARRPRAAARTGRRSAPDAARIGASRSPTAIVAVLPSRRRLRACRLRRRPVVPLRPGAAPAGGRQPRARVRGDRPADARPRVPRAGASRAFRNHARYYARDAARAALPDSIGSTRSSRSPTGTRCAAARAAGRRCFVSCAPRQLRAVRRRDRRRTGCGRWPRSRRSSRARCSSSSPRDAAAGTRRAGPARASAARARSQAAARGRDRRACIADRDLGGGRAVR